MNYNSKYKEYSVYAQNAIENAFKLFADIPEPLISAMKYSINAGGKRLRPVLVIATADIFGGREKALPFAAATEFIHTYSLIHDDMPCMDNDNYRRGIQTNHKIFGEGTAMLAGDALLNAAYEILFEHIAVHPVQDNIKAANIIAASAGGRGMIAGQSIDLYSENNTSAGEKELKYIHANKTGKLICASVLAGAYAAGAEQKYINIFKQLGQKLGMLFQITDDILDVEGSFEKLGKTTGKDNRANKLTYPKVYGISGAREKAQSCYGEIIRLTDGADKNMEFFNQLALKMLNRSK